MDDKLKLALSVANYNTSLQIERKNLRHKLENKMTFVFNGGSFKVDMILINFVHLLVQKNVESAILLDKNQNPIEIQNIQDFFDKIFSLYFESVNDYHDEFTKMRKMRKLEKLIDG